MVLDQQKLEFLEKSLESTDKISIFNEFTQENSEAVFYILELLLKTHDAFLSPYIIFKHPFESKMEEESYFQRLFENILGEEVEFTDHLENVVKNYIVSFKSRTHLLKIFLNVIQLFENKFMNSFTILVKYLLFLEFDENLNLELFEFLMKNFQCEKNSYEINDSFVILSNVLKFNYDKSKFPTFHSAFKKAIYRNEVKLDVGLIQFLLYFMDELTTEEILNYMEFWKVVLQNKKMMKQFCRNSEIIDFYKHCFTKIDKESPIIFEILLICISQLVDVRKEFREPDHEEEMDSDEESKQDELEIEEEYEREEENDEIPKDMYSDESNSNSNENDESKEYLDPISDDNENYCLRSEYFEIFQAIINQNNSLIFSTLIPFVKLLLTNHGEFNQTIAITFFLSFKLNLNNQNEIFQTLVHEGIFHIFFNFLETKEPETQLKILEIFSGNYDLMYQMEMRNEIKLISKSMLKLGQTHHDEIIWEESILEILDFSKENNFKIDFDPEDLLVLIHPLLKFDDSEAFYYRILDKIFLTQEIGLGNALNDTMNSLFEILRDTHLNNNCLQSLTIIFHKLKYDARTWFLQTLEFTMATVEVMLRNLDEIDSEYYIFACRIFKLISTLIKVYEEDVDQMISKSKLFELLCRINVIVDFLTQ
jgi:hypothetical protein